MERNGCYIVRFKSVTVEFMEDERMSVIRITDYREHDDDTRRPFSLSL